MILVLGTACGPVEYIDHVTMKAASELESARAAGAEQSAPYEWTTAVEYLHKAREEEGYSDHQAAVRFGEKAEQAAKDAKAKALSSAASGGSTPPPSDPVKP
jgi:hypothetical protein